MRTSIVIPNYNGEELLRKNLPRVFEAAGYYRNKGWGDVEVIVVDDCSKDQSIEVLKNFNVTLVKNSKNLGFSSTVNRGVEESKGEIVVLLNTDVVPEKDFLKPLIEHFSDESVFAVGCMDRSAEGKNILRRGRGVGRWEMGLLVHARGEVDKTDTLWVGGGSGAFRKTIWQRLGGFDELYNPFYWEDIDLSYRALKSGYTVLFEAKSVVTHEHEKGVIKRVFTEREITTIAYRNQFIFAWKNMTDAILWMEHMLYFPYHLASALVRADLPFFVGFFQAFILLPNIIQSSLKARKLFVKTDREVISPFVT